MVEVLALEEEGGGDPPHTVRSPLEHPTLPEQDPPPPERDILDSAIIDLRAPLDLTADPSKIVGNLEQARIAFLGKAVDSNNTRRRTRELHFLRVQHHARLHASWGWP
jgi:hypothetical protein